jgi:GMP synthase (glutamine-hydrolysing)
VQERRVARLDAPNPLSPPLVAVLGGPIGAYDEASYPSISPLLKLIETRIAAGLPTLGICLRAQLIVRALGARVYPAAQREIGWTRLTLTDAGRASALRHLDGGITSTPACAHDARRSPDPTRLSGDESRVRAPRRVDALS